MTTTDKATPEEKTSNNIPTATHLARLVELEQWLMTSAQIEMAMGSETEWKLKYFWARSVRWAIEREQSRS